MEIGTIETTEEKNEKVKRRATFGSGLGSNGGNKNRGGGGSGGNDGGNDKPDKDFHSETEPYNSNKFRIGMWFLLVVVLMTFGGLIGAYIVVSTNGVIEWKPFDLPIQIWVSTFLLLTSSITFTIAQSALNSDKQERAKKWFLATTVFGAAFVSSQLLAWLALVNRGVYVAGNPYASFFYILTAVHAIHVIGGICILGYVVLLTWKPTISDDELTKRKSMANVAGWYWHFMDGLWIVLFLLLGLWK